MRIVIAIPTNSLCQHASVNILERALSGKSCLCPQFLFNAQQLIELRDPFASAARAGLEMSDTRGNSEISNRRVFGLA